MVGGSPFTAALVAAGLACALVIALAWRRRGKHAARPLAVLMGCGLAWIAAILGSIAVAAGAVGIPLVGPLDERFDAILVAQRGAYFGITATVTAWVLFTAEYAGREWVFDRRVLAALVLEPVAVNLLVWTNGLHRLWWDGVTPAANPAGFEVVAYGPAFWVHAVYSYVLILAGMYFLARFLYDRGSVYRGQAAVVVVAVLGPLVGNLVYLSGLSPVDVTPVGFAVSGSALAYGMFRHELVDVTPVARDTVVSNIGDGVFVLDREDRITDINPAARRILGVEEDREVIGADLGEVFPPGVVERYRDVYQASEEVAVDTGAGRRHFEVDVSPLYDDRDRQVGRLFLVHDVTERKRRERELERQNEQLDQFASLVSHDLRNPLNVADGYLQAAREAADPEVRGHIEEVERSHDRMETLVEDVLALARQGRSVEETEPVDLAAVAREAWENVDTPGATLEVVGHPRILASPDRLLRVFENCYRNAIEHAATAADPDAGAGDRTGGAAPDGGEATVRVRVGPLDGEGSGPPRGFYVEDDGPGIPDDRREEVFRDGYTTADEGTGLGLSIVRSVVEAHGWSVAATEGTEGGARFEVTGVEPAPSELQGAAEIERQ